MLLSHPHRPISRGKKQSRIYVVPPIHPPILNIISKDEVLPEFLDSYIQICQLPKFAEGQGLPQECLKTLYVPSVDQQYEILQSLNELNEKINIREIQPYLMYFMAHQEQEQANDFLVAYQQYQHALDYMMTMLQQIGS